MTALPQRHPKRRRAGFTLIEVLGAVLLSAIVITIVLSFQINLGSAMQNSRERLREQRQAVALLDRVARDLLGSYFIAPSRVQTAAHKSPWIFLAVQDFLEEQTDPKSSNAIKFITRNYVPASFEGHSSDLAVVAYYIEPQEDRPGYKLMRWRTTHMPEDYDPSFPDPEDPRADVIGEDIAWFRILAINHTGGEEPSWDSRQMQGLESLPIGVKLELSVLTAAEVEAANNGEDFEIGEYEEEELDVDVEDDFEDTELGDSRRPTFSKTVMLPLRPLDWSFLEEVARSTSMADLLAADRDGDGIPDSEQVGDDADEGDEDDAGDSLDNGFDRDNEDFDDDFDEDFDDDFDEPEEEYQSLNLDPVPSQKLARMTERASTPTVRA